MSKPILLVLAAGMGSRYGGLKQMDGVGPSGESLLEYTVFDAIRNGFGKVVFVIRESFSEDFKKEIGSKFEDQIEVAYVFQEMEPEIPGLGKVSRVKPWGTAHAVLVAKDEVDAPFAVVNADDFYGQDGIKKAGEFLTSDVSESEYAMIGYILYNTISEHGSVSRGVCQTDGDGYLSRIDERTKIQREHGVIKYYDGDDAYSLDDETVVSMNLWALDHSIFEKLEKSFIEFAKENQYNPKAEFFIPLIIDNLIAEDEVKVKVIPCRAKWYGVTYSDDKEMVQKGLADLTLAGEYPSPLG